MKHIILFFLLIINLLVFGQSKKELRSNIYDLTNKYVEINEDDVREWLELRGKHALIEEE